VTTEPATSTAVGCARLDAGMAALPAVDLYLGSGIGSWALRRYGRRRTGVVFTLDPRIAAEARLLGLDVDEGDPHGRSTGSPIGLSVHYPRLFRQSLLDRYRAVYNLHPGLLPYGRGYFPVFWALWEGTPAGATLHLVTERLDGGPIVSQAAVPYDDMDTGATLHARVTGAERRLLTRAWRVLERGGVLASSPQAGGGTYHARAEFERLRDSTAPSDLSADALVRLARCLTFPGHPGLRVVSNGVGLRLRVESAETLRR